MDDDAADPSASALGVGAGAVEEKPARRGPTAGAEDELLADPPPGRPPGGIDGYRAGRRLRLVIAAVVIGAVAIGGWFYKNWLDAREAEANRPLEPSYILAADVDPADRARQFFWTSGPARLGLSRQDPGVEEIVLPDRRLRLAPGHDVAQVQLDVRDGQTVQLRVLAGDVVQLPPLPAGSPQAPAATAR